MPPSQLALLVLLQELLETEAMATGTAVHQALEAEVSEARSLGHGGGCVQSLATYPGPPLCCWHAARLPCCRRDGWGVVLPALLRRWTAWHGLGLV